MRRTRPSRRLEGRIRREIHARLAHGAPLILLAAACGGPDEAPEAGEAATERPPVEAPEPEEARYQGVLTLEGGAEVVLCDGTPVGVDGPAFLDLLALHAEMTPGLEPMEGIFVDVLGELRQDAGGPWLNALELRRVAGEGWGCGGEEASDLHFEASGTEPFWTVVVLDSVATWTEPGSVTRFVHSGVARLPRGGWEVRATRLETGDSMRLEFWSEPCRNAMSGAWSHLNASVALPGRELAGCGFAGPGIEAAGRSTR